MRILRYFLREHSLRRAMATWKRETMQRAVRLEVQNRYAVTNHWWQSIRKALS